MGSEHDFTATITERGQVTIPAEIRKKLGLKTRGKVTFRLNEDDTVSLRRPAFTIESAFGSIKPMNTPEDWDARIREAKEEKAEETIRKMREN